MTIPIVPGPFSFLRSAGETIGRFDEARRRNRLQNEMLAQQDAEFMLKLIQTPGFPQELISSPGVQDAFIRAGMPFLSFTGVPDPSQRAARGASALAEPEFATLSGYGREQIGAKRAEARAGAAKADVTTQAHTGLSDVQARAVEEVPSQEVAVAQDKATLARIQEEASLAEAVGEYMEEPTFRRMAALARTGQLPVLLEKIRARATGGEKIDDRTFDMLMQPLKDVDYVFNAQLSAWQDLRRTSLPLNIDPGDPRVAEFEAANPRPTYNRVLMELVKGRAEQLWPDLRGRDAVQKYYKTLKDAAGAATDDFIPAERLETLKIGAQQIVDGALSKTDMVAAIRETSDIPSYEIEELERLIAELEGKKNE